jgi:hypothetical protein
MKFRSRFGKNLTIVLGVVLVLAVGVNLGSNLSSLLVSIVTAAWIWNLAYLLLWRPSVEITERDLILNNLIFRIFIPLGNIQRIDTKWALEVITPEGRFVSFSAVAPGRHSTVTSAREDGQHLPETSYIAGTVRPGDLVNSDSGAVAFELRRRLAIGGLASGQIKKSINAKSLIVFGALTVAVFVLWL